MVIIYLYIRHLFVNPILFVDNPEQIKTILEDMKKGETFVRSTIEYAILNDIKVELLESKSTDDNLKKEV